MCGCGMGRLGIEIDDIPQYCPLCGTKTPCPDPDPDDDYDDPISDRNPAGEDVDYDSDIID